MTRSSTCFRSPTRNSASGEPSSAEIWPPSGAGRATESAARPVGGPPVLAVGILYWLVRVLEDYARPVLLWLLPEGWYRPGVGALAVLALVLAAGILARNTLLKQMLELVTRALEALARQSPSCAAPQV